MKNEPLPLPELADVDAGNTDLEQEDTHPTKWPSIPVSVEGIARTRVLPSRRATMSNVPIAANGEVTTLLGRVDQRSTVIISVDVACYLFTERPAAGSTAGYPLPAGGGIGLDYSGELWAVCNGTGAGVAGIVQLMVEE